MDFTEQKNYIFAIFVSLIVHFFLLIYLPGIPVPQQPELKTLNVGLVEFSSGDKIRQISVALNTPEKGRAYHGKTELKSAEEPVQPSKDTAMLPEKEKVAASDTPVEKPESQSAAGGNTKEITGSGNFGPVEPQSFGTGEAMVKIIGPMPSYPPTAYREGKEGKVAVRILVNADGQLDLVIVTKTSGDIRLDYAVTSSIEGKWKFTSINEGYYIDLTFSFDLHIGASVKFLASKTRP